MDLLENRSVNREFPESDLVRQRRIKNCRSSVIWDFVLLGMWLSDGILYEEFATKTSLLT